MSDVRTEHDLLGDRDVPADVYYGVHTARALENFPISGVPISRHSDLVVALASVKQAAAEANQQLGQLDTEIAEAIVAACVEIRGWLVARPVRRRRDPGRGGNVDEHECQRGDRQPGTGDPRP